MSIVATVPISATAKLLVKNLKAKPWIFGAFYAENGEIYSDPT